MGIFPSNDPIQKLRLQRFFMALASYVLWCGFAYICYAAGVLVLPDTMVLPVAGGIACSNLYFYLMLRSGLNKRLDDPSMTFSQILVAMSWILVLIFSTSDHRGLMLTVYTMTMLFGIFQLEATGFLKLAAFGMFGYLCVVALDYTYFPWRFDPVGEGLRVVVLAGTLIWVSLFGAHVNTLKRALRARNRELADAVEEIGNAAKRDHLTKAYNRRYIMEALAREKSRADRTRSPFSVLIVDLDHFKRINDRYGHLAGDRVLMGFTERTLGTLRGMDITDRERVTRTFGRYGGEEFIVVLPMTDLAGALQCADRIRQVTEEQAFDEVFQVTLSAGVAEYRTGESIEDTLRRADGALYQAKSDGRNRAVAAATPRTGAFNDLATGIEPIGQASAAASPRRRA